MPQLGQLHLVLEHVHRVPEARVPVGMELPGGGDGLQRIPLPHHVIGILGDVVEGPAATDEEAAVYPGAALDRLLLKAPDDAVPLGHVQRTEAAGQPYRGKRNEAARGVVGLHERGKVNVRDPVPVGQHEVLVADVGLRPLDPSRSQRILARI